MSLTIHVDQLPVKDNIKRAIKKVKNRSFYFVTPEGEYYIVENVTKGGLKRSNLAETPHCKVK